MQCAFTSKHNVCGYSLLMRLQVDVYAIASASRQDLPALLLLYLLISNSFRVPVLWRSFRFIPAHEPLMGRSHVQMQHCSHSLKTGVAAFKLCVTCCNLVSRGKASKDVYISRFRANSRGCCYHNARDQACALCILSKLTHWAVCSRFVQKQVHQLQFDVAQGAPISCFTLYYKA